MARWYDLATAEAEFAADVRRAFAARKHATVATLRGDGAPRISGTEVEFDDDGDVYLGMMAGARKAWDLRRDPRLALHSPTVDPPEGDPSAWVGEAKIAGRAVEVSDTTDPDQAHRFRIDITEAVFTTVAASRDHLVIVSWHPGRGLERRDRW